MKTIFYLYKRSTINAVRKALKKPITYFFIAFVVFYCTGVPLSFRMMLQDFSMDSPRGLAALAAVMVLMVVPANILSYVKRKGVLYRASDVHFLFTAPVSPKTVLLYPFLRGLFGAAMIQLVICVFGVVAFHVPLWKMAVYFLVAVCVQNVLEGFFTVVLYGSEDISETGRKVIRYVTYGVFALTAAVFVYYYFVYGLNLEMVISALTSPAVRMIPVIGWYIALMQLIFVGPMTSCLVGAGLYAVFFLFMLYTSIHCKCTGEYYEDAVKFADDYEEAVNKRKQGQQVDSIGKKKVNLKAASVTYRGHGARAIYYRQMLEYKKRKYFLFDMYTLINLVIGVILGFVGYKEHVTVETLAGMIMPAISMYFTFIFISINGKWGKELTMPYTYLIPDTNARKLWYATLVQNIQALINGTLLLLPMGIVMKCPPVVLVLNILLYVLFCAGKLYGMAVSEIVVGSTLGSTGKSFVLMFLQCFIMGVAAAGALICTLLFKQQMLGYFIMDLLVFLVVGVFFVIATLNFERMEKSV